MSRSFQANRTCMFLLPQLITHGQAEPPEGSFKFPICISSPKSVSHLHSIVNTLNGLPSIVTVELGSRKRIEPSRLLHWLAGASSATGDFSPNPDWMVLRLCLVLGFKYHCRIILNGAITTLWSNQPVHIFCFCPLMHIQTNTFISGPLSLRTIPS